MGEVGFSASPRPRVPASDPAILRAIDVDLHHQITDWRAVAPYVPEGLRWRVLRPAGPPMARHGYKKVGVAFGDAPIPRDDQGRALHPAGDPAWVKEQYLDKQGIDRAILTGGVLGLGVQPGPDLSAAIARGVNDWTLATWVRPYDCYKGSILIAQQDPAQAVAEIDRLGDDPGMVQVLMCSASESPYGRRAYHPIYEACARHNLPLALHIGAEGAGISARPTGAGHPSTYFEWYGSLPQVYMAHIVSMVSEGVFEKYPTLRVVLYEGGIAWLPHLIWRFDKNWRAEHAAVPWLRRPPSEYIFEHFRSTTYPLEKLDPADLRDLLGMVRAGQTLLFSSNYPGWEYGDPFEMIADLPDQIRRQVLVDNALALYGDRLLAPNR
jgi:predicted TIM-barrel fold metal-dependent hydrolase